MSPPTPKKASSADAVAKAFAEAGDEVPLGDEDRDALLEAAADPRWIRMSRGDAFERLVCEPDDTDEDE
jgi:hypothetical protein